jgi:hypothetical protein
VPRLHGRLAPERRARRAPPPLQAGLRHRWLHAVIAVQASIILGLGAAWLHTAVPGAAYRTLGAADLPVARMVVVFDPHLSEAQMRRLVRASEARIVDGPTDAGAYVLSVPAARAATVREALRAAPGVTLVENLDATASER